MVEYSKYSTSTFGHPNLGKVIVHFDPTVEYDGDKTNTNFDYWFCYSVYRKRTAQLAGKRYINCSQDTKDIQHLKLKRIFIKHDLNLLTTPKAYMAITTKSSVLPARQWGVPDAEKLVIKPMLGARGDGHVLLPRHAFGLFMGWSQGMTWNQIKEHFPTFKYSADAPKGQDEEPYWTDDEQLHVCEYVPNVVAEWRILFGGKRVIGRERRINGVEYKQANINPDDVVEDMSEAKYLPLDELFVSNPELANQIYTLTQQLHIPVGSLDLYKTDDGKFGIFEYSNQYAFRLADPHVIQQLWIDGLVDTIL